MNVFIIWVAGFIHKDMDELCTKCIEDDDENEPAPGAGGQIETWKVPNTCPRAVGNFTNSGKCNNFFSDVIAGMSKFQLWLMCFPIKFLINTMCLVTSKTCLVNSS